MTTFEEKMDKKWKGSTRCHKKHPVLKIGGGEVLGASCVNPVDGYDIYIGFCRSMTQKYLPWEGPDGNLIIEFCYSITDGCAPKNPDRFKAMIAWVVGQLAVGKKVHVGCIGGHGRTGLFLSALVSQYPELTDDPIAWVRENHCKKAVESTSQIAFLHTHFGCKKHEPSKPHVVHESFNNGSYNKKKQGNLLLGHNGTDDWSNGARGSSARRVSCIPTSEKSIWYERSLDITSKHWDN